MRTTRVAPLSPSGGRPDIQILERRLSRLREELLDERVPLRVDAAAAPVLTELLYARRPPRHEHRAPAYGALVFAGAPAWDNAPIAPVLVDGDGIRADVLRRCADGRNAFTIVTPDGVAGLATFERSLADELAGVRLHRTGATVVQRLGTGLLRVCSESGVTYWNGSTWLHKPFAEHYVRALTLLAPNADPAVLGGLLELAVHELAAEQVGATILYNVDHAPPDDDRGGSLEFRQAVIPPPVTVTRRASFPVLSSILSQTDLAAVVGGDGSVGPIGVRLHHSRHAGELVRPLHGARHTSARRLTFDVEGTLAVVVSESGRVTVFAGGAAAVTVSASPGEIADASDIDETSTVHCAKCNKTIVVTTGQPTGTSDNVACPVCAAQLDVAGSVRVLGVKIGAGLSRLQATIAANGVCSTSRGTTALVEPPVGAGEAVDIEGRDCGCDVHDGET